MAEPAESKVKILPVPSEAELENSSTYSKLVAELAEPSVAELTKLVVAGLPELSAEKIERAKCSRTG